MNGRRPNPRVLQVAAEIRRAAINARKIDPDTRGRVSYPGLCGGLQAILTGLVRDTYGDDARAIVQAALDEADNDESDDARPFIAAFGSAA